MSSITKVSIIASILLVERAMGYSQTLTDCQTVAKMFKNTCSGAPSTAATWTTSGFTGSTVTCSQSKCPSNGGTAPNCSWSRKLCVTCS